MIFVWQSGFAAPLGTGFVWSADFLILGGSGEPALVGLGVRLPLLGCG